MPITYKQVASWPATRRRTPMRVRSLALYRYGRDYARERGIIIADTKFEFGWLDDEVILIDEALTPDSSRFWPADQYQAGRRAAQLRQAVRPRLPERDRLGQDAAGAGAARRKWWRRRPRSTARRSSA